MTGSGVLSNEAVRHRGLTPDEGIGERLARIESMLAALLERETVKEWYTTTEFGKAIGKGEFTTREYCRLGRLNAVKRSSGRGAHHGWAISHEELQRYRRYGLLPARTAAAAH